MSDEMADNSRRDEVFQKMKGQPDNLRCIDCNKKNPRWTSLYLGVLICFECSGKHRQYSVKYSFVKSTTLDSWTSKQLLYMEKGGNKKALDYFRNCGMVDGDQRRIDYKSDLCQRYRTILNAQVQNSIAQALGKPIVQIPVIEQPIKIELKVQTKQQPIQIVIQKPVTFTSGAGKKKKKIQASKLNVDDFQSMKFDDGIRPQDIKSMQTPATLVEQTGEFSSTQPYIQPPKPMTVEAAQETLKTLKNKNLKAVSSDDFKVEDNAKASSVLLTHFADRKSIGSAQLFNQGVQSSVNEKLSEAWSSAKDRLLDWKSKLSTIIKK